MLKTVSVTTVLPTSRARSMPSRVTIGADAGPQAVAGHHPALAEALGARGADVVLAHRVDHVARARRGRRSPRTAARARIQGRIMWRNQSVGALGEGHVARAREPAEFLPEDVEHHQAEPEDGRRDADQREAHRQRGRRSVPRLSAESTPIGIPISSQRIAPADGDLERHRRRVDDLLAHRRAGVVREPEARPAVLVAEHEALDVEPVLHGHRLVEPELLLAPRRSSSGVGLRPANATAGSVEGSTKKMVNATSVTAKTTRTT